MDRLCQINDWLLFPHDANTARYHQLNGFQCKWESDLKNIRETCCMYWTTKRQSVLRSSTTMRFPMATIKRSSTLFLFLDRDYEPIGDVGFFPLSEMRYFFFLEERELRVFVVAGYVSQPRPGDVLYDQASLYIPHIACSPLSRDHTLLLGSRPVPTRFTRSSF